MSTIVVLFHSERSDAAAATQDLLGWLGEAGHTVVMASEDAAELARSDLAFDFSDHAAVAVADIALAISIGGDGTMLRAFDLLASHQVPVMGINVGHLGYLTEFELHNMIGAVQSALDENLTIEDRMMIEATLVRAPQNVSAGVDSAARMDSVGVDSAARMDSVGVDSAAAVEGGLGPWIGLNEVILEKRDLGHTIRTEVMFDSEEFAIYAADGLIISTPTGSTAYSLSAGGSVVAPTHRSLQLTPVAPHMLFDRSIMLGPEAEIRCRILGVRSANLAIDGRSVAKLNEGDVLIVRRSDTQARLITSDTKSFHAVLKHKLGLINR